MIRAVSDTVLEVVGEVADRMVGATGGSDAELAAAVAQLSEVYTRRREAIDEQMHDRRSLAARLRFFLPRDLPKVMGPLSELEACGALPRQSRWRILDLGAGLGTTTLGTALFAAQSGLAEQLEVVAVDQDPRTLRIFEALADRAPEMGMVPIEVHTRQTDLASARAHTPEGRFDLVLLGFVLNELKLHRGQDADREAQARGDWLADWAGSLTPSGSLVVLEPALREVSRNLQRVRDHVVARQGPLHVFAPCLRGCQCPMLETERDWCHEELRIPLPERLTTVARGAGLRFERLTWSYLTLRRDGRSLRELATPREGEPYRIVSAPMPSKGKLEMLACGRPGLARAMRLDRHASQPNAALEAAQRGSLVMVQNTVPENGWLRLRERDRVELLKP
jgi:ribosomal protein RSM22 (predicted rRNA methylase)